MADKFRKYKIGIYCEREISDDDVTSVLIAQNQFNPICYDSLKELIEDHQSAPFHAVSLGFNTIFTQQSVFMDQIFRSFKNVPLALLCRNATSLYHKEDTHMGKNYFSLCVPQELDSLPGILLKMIDANHVAARQDLRHKINFKIHFLNEEKRGICRLTDISYGGASAIIEDGDIHKGDFLSFQLPVVESLRDRWVSAQVVWEKIAQTKNKQYKKVGLVFASPSQA